MGGVPAWQRRVHPERMQRRRRRRSRFSTSTLWRSSRAVRELQLPAVAIRQRVAEWIAAPPPDHFVLIDPDADAREILLTEIRKLTTGRPSEISVEEAAKPEALLAAIPLCRPSKTKIVRAVLPAGMELITLPDSVGEQMARSRAAIAEGQADRRRIQLGGFPRDCADDAGGCRS